MEGYADGLRSKVHDDTVVDEANSQEPPNRSDRYCVWPPNKTFPRPPIQVFGKDGYPDVNRQASKQNGKTSCLARQIPINLLAV
jgi:hypothetical protein